MAVAARVMMISSASNVTTTTTTSLLFKSPFLRPHTLTPSFFIPNNNNRLLLSKKRFFNCRALYKPSIKTKEEGLPKPQIIVSSSSTTLAKRQFLIFCQNCFQPLIFLSFDQHNRFIISIIYAFQNFSPNLVDFELKILSK